MYLPNARAAVEPPQRRIWLWRIGIAWNQNSEKVRMISLFVKVVQAVADQV
jgi:hypothetical protein